MKDEKIRVCECFAACDFLYGGMEEFLINMITNFSDSRMKYTLFVPGSIGSEKIKSLPRKDKMKIISRGVHYRPGVLKKIELYNVYKNFFKTNKFDVVHIHCSNIVELALAVKTAKKAGIKHVIAHSHNASVDTLIGKIKQKVFKPIIGKYTDQYLACSDLAAQCMFPNKIIKNKNYTVIKNGINVEKFAFNPESRNEYRKNLGINDEFVLCNVGRFHFQKNHEFIVDIAKKLSEKKNNYKFILVGDGELKEEIIKKVADLQLSDKFIFLEKRSDIAQIMMASDVFVFPSIFEGLGIVAIEAQATGLPVICSTCIPNETKLTDIINYVDLSNFDKWVQVILNYQNKGIDRTKYAEQVKSAGYDAKTSANVLEEIYAGVYNK